MDRRGEGNLEGNVELEGCPPAHVPQNMYYTARWITLSNALFSTLPSGYPHEGMIACRARPGAQILNLKCGQIIIL